MLTWTSCTSCGGSLAVSYVGQMTHPTCESHPDERLAREFCDAVQRGDEPEMVRLEKLLNAPRPEPKLGPSALWYAKTAGWPIFPCHPGTKEPMTRHGFKDATTDESQIRKWWKAEPLANIAGATGYLYDVIDIDEARGFESFRNLESGVVPDIHGKANTPRGQHIFIKKTGDRCAIGFRPGLDFKGELGYVILSPSSVGGRSYSWVMKPSPEIMSPTPS